MERVEVFTNPDEAIENATMRGIPKKKTGTSIQQHHLEGNRGGGMCYYWAWEVEHVTCSCWYKNFLSFSLFLVIFSLSYCFGACKVSHSHVSLFLYIWTSYPFFFSFLICVSFIPRNWNGGLVGYIFFCAYIHFKVTYIHMGLEGSEVISFFL